MYEKQFSLTTFNSDTNKSAVYKKTTLNEYFIIVNYKKTVFN